jgi:hypothetical protein
VPKFDPEERKRLDGVFGKFGHKSWTRLNLHERVAQIEHFWESSDEALEALRFYRDIPQRENNQTLHVSALARGRLREPRPIGRGLRKDARGKPFSSTNLHRSAGSDRLP